MNPFEETDEVQNIETTLIEIWLEVNGRKKNTFISGWNLSDTELKDHIKIIKKKNGCNGTLKEITISEKIEKVIQLQGDHVEYIQEYLKLQMIDCSLIRVKG